MAEVFISHSSIDKALAERLCAELEERGIKCWIAPRDIVPGSEWAAAISNALSTTKVLLLIYSYNSARSTQVPKELSIADKRGMFIIPYKIDDAQLEGVFDYYLTGAHWIMAEPQNEDYKVEELYSVITSALQPNSQVVTNNTYIDKLTINNSTLTQNVKEVEQTKVAVPKADPVQKGENTENKKTSAGTTQKSNKGLLGVVIGIGCLIVALLVVVIVMLGGNNLNEKGQVNSGNPVESAENKTPDSTTTEDDKTGENAEESAITNDFEYEIVDGTVTITKYVGNSVNVVVPEEIDGVRVTAIGDASFAECTELKSIVLPNGIETIGEEAFLLCESLKQIEIPDSVTTIKRWAFQETGLTSVVIPDSVTQLEMEGFIYCKDLTTVVLSKNLEVLEDNMFWGCTSLATIVLPDNLKVIEQSAFRESGLKNIVIPDNVSYVGECAFLDCKELSSVTLSATMTEITPCMFFNCSSLTSIVIPTSVTIVGNSAFSNSGLTEISIPNNVISMGAEVFLGCTNLEYAELSSQIMCLPPGTFYDCSNMKNISMNKGMEVIGDFAFAYTGFSNFNLHKFSVKEIGRGAFMNCANLETISLPDTLLKISEGAFQECFQMTQITIPDSVKGCAMNAFYGDSSITITFRDTPYVLLEEGFLNAELYNAINVTQDFEYTIANGGATITGYKGTDPNVVIPESLDGVYVVAIGDEAFKERSDIEFVTMFYEVKNIGISAFAACKNLKTVELSREMTSIGNAAFKECDNLEYVEMPLTLTELGRWVFAKSALKFISIPQGVESVKYASFHLCKQLESVYLPLGIVTIEPGAFDSTGLRNVSLPDTVTEVATNAFTQINDLSLTYDFIRYSNANISELPILVDMGQ